MSELALPLLLLIILGSLVAAAPPLTGLSSGQSSAGGRGVHPGAAAAWASLLFALALSGASAAVFAVTVLHQQGDFGILAALAGTLAAAAASRRLRRRRLAVPALLAVGLLVLLLVLYRLAIPGEGVAPLQLLGRELQGSDPAQLQALLLIELCWVVGAWVGWFAIAEGSGLVASGLPLVAMLSDLINAPVGVEAKPVIPVLLASMAAVALIGSTHHLRQLPLWRSMSDLEKTPTVGRQLRVVVALAVGVAVLALALPPLSRTNISWRFFGGSQVNGPPLAYAESPSGYAIDVIPGGPIRNVSTQVLTYGTNAPFGSTYLQGEVFTDFSAGNWFPRYDTSVLLGSGSGLPYVGQASRLRDRRTIRLTVHYQGEASSAPPDVLYGGSPLRTPTAGPGYQVSGQAQGQRFLDVDQVTPEITDTTVISAGRSLTTYATVSTASPDQLERAGRRYPKWVLPLANLDGAGDPSQLAQVLTAAKQMAGSASNPYAEARNIQDTLRREETYTLDPPPAPNGTWPLLYFLNTSHRGYCQYFASAMGAMLRALGIPSRLAGGFDSGVRGIITEADAHVWVQAYFPHYGWVNFEPTPSVFTRIAHPTPGGVAASTGPTDSPTSAGAGGARFHAGVRGLVPTGPLPRPAVARSRTPWLLPLGGALGGLLLALCLGLLWWSRRARSPAQLRARLGLLITLSGRSRPASRTVHELALACAQLDPRLEARLQALADQADRIAFGPPGGREGASLNGWEPVGRRYPRLLWRAWAQGRQRRASARTTAERLSLSGS